MAIKLTKTEATQLDKLHADFLAARDALFEKLDDIASEWESEWSDKSERWQDGEGGQTAQEKIDLLRAWADELPGEGDPAVDTDALL